MCCAMQQLKPTLVSHSRWLCYAVAAKSSAADSDWQSQWPPRSCSLSTLACWINPDHLCFSIGWFWLIWLIWPTLTWFVSRSFDVSCVHSKHAISSLFDVHSKHAISLLFETLLFGPENETGYDTKCHVFLACLFFEWFCSCVFLLGLHVQIVRA